MIIADERSELAVHKARLDSFVADETIQRVLEQQVVADGVEKNPRSLFEPALAKSQFHAGKWYTACNDTKLQLQDALDKLKLSEDKVTEFQAKMQELHADAQQAIDAVLEEAQDREKESIRHFESRIS